MVEASKKGELRLSTIDYRLSIKRGRRHRRRRRARRLGRSMLAPPSSACCSDAAVAPRATGCAASLRTSRDPASPPRRADDAVFALRRTADRGARRKLHSNAGAAAPARRRPRSRSTARAAELILASARARSAPPGGERSASEARPSSGRLAWRSAGTREPGERPRARRSPLALLRADQRARGVLAQDAFAQRSPQPVHRSSSSDKVRREAALHPQGLRRAGYARPLPPARPD